jgi:hypothetical protein
MEKSRNGSGIGKFPDLEVGNRSGKREVLE